MASGRDAQIGWAVESTAGLQVTPTAFLWLLEDGMDIQDERVESAGIIQGRRGLASGQWAPGSITVDGSFGFELYNRGFGKLMRGCFGGVNTTGPVSSQYTHTFTPGDTSDDSLTVQVGVPSVGGTVYPKTAGGVSVTSWELACAVGEAAAFSFDFVAMNGHIGTRSVTDGATTISDTTVTSVTGAFSAKDVGKPISGTGIPTGTVIASINSATSVETSLASTATATGLTLVIGKALASASYPADLVPFWFTGGAVTIAGSAVDVASATISADLAKAVERRFLGRRGIKQAIDEGLWEVTGELEMEFESLTQWERFQDGTEFALVLSFTSGVDTATFTLNIRYDGGTPMVEGTDIVPQTVAFKAVGDTDAEMITCVLVNADVTA
jgi:uncharacterized protein (DUF433 family)